MEEVEEHGNTENKNENSLDGLGLDDDDDDAFPTLEDETLPVCGVVFSVLVCSLALGFAGVVRLWRVLIFSGKGRHEKAYIEWHGMG